MVSDCVEWEGRLRKEDNRAVRGRTEYPYRDGVPQGLIAHHVCENPSCVNSEHIEATTRADHIRHHGLTGDHHQQFKTHCPQRHEYTEENTYRWNNERHCKQCRRDAKRRYRARLKAAKLGW